MTTYTLTVNEAETQLHKLVKQTRTTHQPVILTGEETAEPLVVLVESTLFETLRKRERQLFHLHLQQLFHLLDDAKSKLSGEKLSEQFLDQFISDFRTTIRSVWDLCSPNARKLCAMLRMAGSLLSKESLTLMQIATLRECAELLRFESPSFQDIRLCFRKLMACGLPPMITGDDALVQMYVDEL